MAAVHSRTGLKLCFKFSNSVRQDTDETEGEQDMRRMSCFMMLARRTLRKEELDEGGGGDEDNALNVLIHG
jgi:hypothetical protein